MKSSPNDPANTRSNGPNLVSGTLRTDLRTPRADADYLGPALEAEQRGDPGRVAERAGAEPDERAAVQQGLLDREIRPCGGRKSQFGTEIRVSAPYRILPCVRPTDITTRPFVEELPRLLEDRGITLRA